MNATQSDKDTKGTEAICLRGKSASTAVKSNCMKIREPGTYQGFIHKPQRRAYEEVMVLYLR